MLLKQQQKYDDARQFYIQALQIRRETLGTNHVDVAASLNNLALLNEACEHYLEALVLHDETLNIRLNVLGPDHPSVAETLVNIGLLHKRNRDFDAARESFEKALNIYEQYPTTSATGEIVSGVDSADSIATRNLILSLNELALADANLEDFTRSDSRVGVPVAGDTRPSNGDRQTSVTSFVDSVVDGVTSAAAMPPAYSTISSLNMRAFRNEHEKLALSLRSMGLSLQGRGELLNAQSLFEQSLCILVENVGGQYMQSEICADAMVLLAILLREQGKYAACKNLLDIALNIYKSIVKDGDVGRVIDTSREIATTLNFQHEYAQSILLLGEVQVCVHCF